MCADCRAVKNYGNNQWYETVKNTPEFRAYLKKITILNKIKKREYDRAYRARTAEKQAEWSREWALKNPEKVRAIQHNYKARRRTSEACGASSKEICAWSESQTKVCYWCGIKCAESYHIDHYHPLSRGGKHEIENLVIACPTCNVRKNAKDPYEFAQKEMGRLF